MNGFLGTEASLGSDLSLIITLILGGVAAYGGIQARKKKFNKHCPLMETAALLNWIPVLVVMVPAWAGVLTGESTSAANGFSSVPIFHGVLGGLTQLLMTFTVIRMAWLKNIPPKNTRLLMKATIAMWMLTTLGGVGVYLVLYVI